MTERVCKLLLVAVVAATYGCGGRAVVEAADDVAVAPVGPVAVDAGVAEPPRAPAVTCDSCRPCAAGEPPAITCLEEVQTSCGVAESCAEQRLIDCCAPQ